MVKTKDYIDFLKDDLVDFVVRVYFEDLLEVLGWVIVGSCKDGGFLDFVHEGTVTIAVGNHHTWLICQSVGDYHVPYILEQKFLRILNKRLIHLC
jgi:hypothetical protein